jgi:hypothetical protein
MDRVQNPIPPILIGSRQEQCPHEATQPCHRPEQPAHPLLPGEMEPVVPWKQLLALIEPHAPVAKTGRPPFALAAMLRIHFMQQWFGLSDMAMQKALFDTPMHRHFAGLDGMARRPRRINILRFRHLLQAHRLAAQFLATVNQQLAAKGCPCCADQGVRPPVSLKTAVDRLQSSREPHGY